VEKRCPKCGAVKPLEAFHRNARRADGRAWECRTCVAAHYVANAERLRAKRYAEVDRVKLAHAAYRAANAETLRSKARAYRAANLEKVTVAQAAYRAANAEKRRANRAANRAAYVANTARYRATKLRATPAWANLDTVAAYYVLAAAMTEASGVRHEVDHIEPLRGKHVCGLHNEFNLQVLPAPDNGRKGNRPSEVRAPVCVGPVPPKGGAAWR